MSAGLLAAVAVAYLWVALSYFRDSRPGMGLAFIAYALANIGFIVDLWRRQ